MARKGQKRRHDDDHEAYVDPVADDSIESCLAALEGQSRLVETEPTPTTPVEDDASPAVAASSLKESTELCDPTLSNARTLSTPEKERLSTWNRCMNVWQKNGAYTAGLLPSFDIELARHFKVQELSKYLLDACRGIKMPVFERWMIDSKIEEDERFESADPVLSRVSPNFQSSQRLLEEIRETCKITRAQALGFVRELCKRVHTAIREIVERPVRQTPLKNGDRVELEGRAPVLTLLYRRKTWQKPFCIKINATHYNKLKDMFLRHHSAANQDMQNPLRLTDLSGKLTKTMHAFHHILMVLLLRYSSLSGGQLILDLRGGGMQGAIHGEVFHVLRKHFHKDTDLLEGFGSPLNAYLSSFCSAFSEDIDWHFGSVGNFLKRDIVKGCCEANPPFSPGMMTAMSDQIEHNIAEADEIDSAVTFVVVVPNAGKEADEDRAAAKRFGGVSLKKMLESPACRRHVLLSAKEHGYIEGAQHMRPTRFKESLYATSIIILQSERARSRSLDEEVLEKDLREAFVSRHRSETEERRELNNNSG